MLFPEPEGRTREEKIIITKGFHILFDDLLSAKVAVKKA